MQDCGGRDPLESLQHLFKDSLEKRNRCNRVDTKNLLMSRRQGQLVEKLFEGLHMMDVQLGVDQMRAEGGFGKSGIAVRSITECRNSIVCGPSRTAT